MKVTDEGKVELGTDGSDAEALVEIICKILEAPEVLNGVLASIPQKWAYDEEAYGEEEITKVTLARWYLWEVLVAG